MQLFKRIVKQGVIFLKVIRHRHWHDKIHTLTAAAILLLLFSGKFDVLYKETLLYSVYLYFPFTFGYLFNSFGDKKEDSVVGKDMFEGVSKQLMLTVTVIAGVGTFLVPILFYRFEILIIVGIGALLLIFYSLPGVKLKTKGLTGLITASVAQRLPFLFYWILLLDEKYLTLYLFGWLLLISFLIELKHQLEDLRVDEQVAFKTFAVGQGLDKMRNYIYAVTFLLGVYLCVPFGLGIFCPMGSLILLPIVLAAFTSNTLYYIYTDFWRYV